MVQTRAASQTANSKKLSESTTCFPQYDKNTPGLWIRTVLATVRTTKSLRVLTAILQQAADPTDSTFDAVDDSTSLTIIDIIDLTADSAQTILTAKAQLTTAAVVEALISQEAPPTAIVITPDQFQLIATEADNTLYAQLLIALQTAYSIEDVVAGVGPGCGTHLFILIVNVLTYNRTAAADDLLDRLNSAHINNQGTPHSLANHQKFFKRCLANYNAFTPRDNQILGKTAVDRYCKQLTKLKAKAVTAAIKADSLAANSLIIAYRKAESEASDYGITWNTKRDQTTSQANAATANRRNTAGTTPAPPKKTVPAPPVAGAATANAADANPRCTKCCKTGHTKENCPNTVVCYNCGKEGHLSRDCSDPQSESTRKYHERKAAAGAQTPATSSFASVYQAPQEHVVDEF